MRKIFIGIGALLVVGLSVVLLKPFFVEAAASPSTPTYTGGGDSSGLTNSGTSAQDFGIGSGEYSVVAQGNYAYVMMVASSTACAATTSAAGNGCELKVFDVSNPASPTYVAGGDATGSTNSGTGSINGRGIAISGNFLYTTWNNSNTTCSATPGSAIGCELKVWDISNPLNPTYVGGADSTGATNTGTGNVVANTVQVSGNFAYTTWNVSAGACAGTVPASGCEFKVFDISTPSAPTYAGGMDSNGTTNGSGAGIINGLGIAISGNTVYTTWAGDATLCVATSGLATGCELKVIDVTTPSTPTLIGGGDVDGSTGAGTGNLAMRGVVVSGTFAYTLEDNSATGCSNTAGSAIGCELKTWDVTTPALPTYSTGNDATGTNGSGTGSVLGFNVFISGGYLYTIWSSNATACSGTTSAIGCEIKVFTLATPSTPAYAGGGDAGGDTNTGTVASAGRSVYVLGAYLYSTWAGNATPCSATPGSAIGCELKVWQIKVLAGVIIIGLVQTTIF